jgi:hypothetical protein
MADVLLLEFNASPEDYKAVNKILGIDQDTGDGDWPAGMLSHVGAAGSNGNLVVVEVWDTQASQGAFMADRLGPALGEVGLGEPTRVEWMTALGNHHTH